MPSGPRPARTFEPRAGLAPCLLGLALLAGAPSAVAAQDAPAETERGTEPEAPLLPVRVSAQASFTWEGELAVGGRVDYPLIQRSLMLSTRDEVSLSGGLDVVFKSFEGSDPLAFWPTATVQWSLELAPRFAFYPELGLAAQIERGKGFQGVFPNIGFGGRYFLWRSVALTARIGWPMAISLGACF